MTAPKITSEDEMEVLHRIITSINLNPNLDHILETLYQHLVSLLGISILSVVRNGITKEKYHRVFLFDLNGKKISSIQPEPVGNDYIEKTAIQTGAIQVVNRGENWVVIPLTQAHQVIGALSLGWDPENSKFNKSSPAFYNTLADLIVSSLIQTNNRVEDVSDTQDVDLELRKTQKIDPTLQLILSAAIDHTHAKTGFIGLIDEGFKNIINIWQFSSKKDKMIRLEPLQIKELPWFTKEMISPQVIHKPGLTERLSLPDTFQWHYVILSEVKDDQWIFLCLHLDTPQLLQKQDQAYLAKLNNHAVIALNNAALYENLDNAIHAKNEFINFISHELKNPLTVIKGYADIIRKGMAGEITDEQKDYLTTITHNVNQMNTFIKDLSDQSQIETQSLGLIFESTPVNEIITEVLQTYEAQVYYKSIHMEQQLIKPLANVWCDRLRLIQILSNLVSNAIKYTPETGSVEIGAEQSFNQWDSEGTAEVIHFWVKDTGLGISPEDQAHLFEKFYRGADPRKQKIPGTGLGLRISKSLTEMMGGKMWFESQIGEGSTFHFTIPI